MQTKKWKQEWDLSVLYKSIKDPQIEKDVAELERKLTSFAKKYSKDKAYLKSPKALKTMLDTDEKLGELPGSVKPLRYIHLLEDSGYRSNASDKLQKQIVARFQKLSILTQPIFLEIGKVSKAQQKKFLQAPELAEYKYYLEQIFNNAKYQLSEAEEKIMTLKSQPASAMWVDGVEKVVSDKLVEHKGKQLTIGQATVLLKSLPTSERRALHKKICEKLMEVADYSEGEMNAFVTNKKINDELRGFKHSYSASLLGHETREQDIIPFTELVTKNFKIAHKFYALKKKLLKLDTFYYEDRLGELGSVKQKYPFTDSAKFLHDSFMEVNPKYAEILDSFLVNGQIDAYPRKGKRGGAYMSSSTKVPTNVLLNHADDFYSVTTFAHEMGHAIHTELTDAVQPPHYQGYSLAVAETASTFFENFAFEKMFATLSDKEKIIALHDKIDASIATIFRQVAAFNFELELHERIRTEGYLSHKEIADLLMKHMKSYIGPALTTQDHDGYYFVAWSHFRNPFYVYTYAYGELISTALYEKYKENPKNLARIEKIFEAGSSMPPHKIFKQAGIDTTKTDFFELGLKKIEKDIKLLENLTK